MLRRRRIPQVPVASEQRTLFLACLGERQNVVAADTCCRMADQKRESILNRRGLQCQNLETHRRQRRVVLRQLFHEEYVGYAKLTFETEHRLQQAANFHVDEDIGVTD